MHTKQLVLLVVALVVILGVAIYFAIIPTEEGNSLQDQSSVSLPPQASALITPAVQQPGELEVPIIRRCNRDADCILAKEKWCQIVIAINKNYQKQWTEEDAAAALQAEVERQTCKVGSAQDINDFSPRCSNSRCTAERNSF